MTDQSSDKQAQDIENLIELFNRSDWDEMHLKTDELEIFLSNDPNATAVANVVAVSNVTAPAVAPVPVSNDPSVAPTSSSPGSAGDGQSVSVDVPEGMVAITAPNLGTFYRAPKPGAAPYVEVGQDVDENTDVCLIEVMKLFTPVKAGVKGRVHSVAVSDGTMVEFDQVLVIIDPAG